MSQHAEVFLRAHRHRVSHVITLRPVAAELVADEPEFAGHAGGDRAGRDHGGDGRGRGAGSWAVPPAGLQMLLSIVVILNSDHLRLEVVLASGIAKPRQIFFAKLFGISTCLGTASTAPVRGFNHRECRAPSRLRMHPWNRRWRSNDDLFMKWSPFPEWPPGALLSMRLPAGLPG